MKKLYDMERPRVRYLDVQPYGDKFLVTDPFGISKPILITPELFLIMSLMDGSRSENDIKAEFFKSTGLILSSEDYRNILKTLDEGMYLLNARFFNRLKKFKEDMLKKGVKEPFHAGEAYPDKPEELKKFLERSLEVEKKEEAIGILVPHMDMRVAIDTYGKTYGRIIKETETVIVLGVSHYIHETPMSVCPLDFETPLGRLETDKEVVNKLKKMFDYDIFHDILSYQKEHSIEFQTVFIKYMFPKAKIVPVIVSYGDEQVLKDVADKMTEAIDGKDILIVSSVDMSHVGRKFGDPYSYDPSERDKEYICLLEKLDSLSAFRLLQSDNNRTRIDGQFTNFVFAEILKNLGAKKGKRIDYQIYHEEPTDSKVSYAGMIFS